MSQRLASSSSAASTLLACASFFCALPLMGLTCSRRATPANVANPVEITSHNDDDLMGSDGDIGIGADGDNVDHDDAMGHIDHNHDSNDRRMGTYIHGDSDFVDHPVRHYFPQDLTLIPMRGTYLHTEAIMAKFDGDINRAFEHITECRMRGWPWYIVEPNNNDSDDSDDDTGDRGTTFFFWPSDQ